MITDYTYRKKLWALVYETNKDFIRKALKESLKSRKPWSEGIGLQLVDLIRKEIYFMAPWSNNKIFKTIDKYNDKMHTKEIGQQSKIK